MVLLDAVDMIHMAVLSKLLCKVALAVCKQEEDSKSHSKIATRTLFIGRKNIVCLELRSVQPSHEHKTQSKSKIILESKLFKLLGT